MGDFYKMLMSQPTVNRVAGTTNTSGTNALVAAPGAGNRLVVLYVYVQNESANETVAKFQFGATDVTRSTLGQYVDYERECCMVPWILPENTALNLDLSGANAHAYIVEYVIAPSR
jgi:hypothetical protein